MSATAWTVVFGVATVTLTLVVIALSIRQELRARTRDDIEWAAERLEQGVFLVRNVGEDTAYRVRMELWTRDEHA